MPKSGSIGIICWGNNPDLFQDYALGEIKNIALLLDPLSANNWNNPEIGHFISTA